MNIRYIHRKDIDTEKWDALIAGSTAESIYPYSWYLDVAAENWSALVSGDYKFAMPLVWKQKYGIRYLYQPTFCQQLGVFSREHVDPSLAKEFMERAMGRYRFGVVNFNHRNLLGELHASNLDDRSNYILPLNKSYEELSGLYSVNAKRNLKKAVDNEALSLDREVSLPELMDFKKQKDALAKAPSVYERWEEQFRSIMEKGEGHIYGIRKDGNLLAATFLAQSQRRIIYLLSVSNEEGKEARAMFRIIDDVIRRWASSEYVLDFEGSNIPSIARFFRGFGASPEIYQSISFNRFPLSFIFGRNYGK